MCVGVQGREDRRVRRAGGGVTIISMCRHGDNKPPRKKRTVETRRMTPVFTQNDRKTSSPRGAGTGRCGAKMMDCDLTGAPLCQKKNQEKMKLKGSEVASLVSPPSLVFSGVSWAGGLLLLFCFGVKLEKTTE